MSEHIKEPWGFFRLGEKMNCSFVIGSTGEPSANDIAHLDHLGEANARRIVACVNCLTGIETEEIESGLLKMVLEKVAEELARFRKGRPDDQPAK